ncbi:MAG: DUF3656 domain-containing protein [Fuerstiella sp.]
MNVKSNSLNAELLAPAGDWDCLTAAVENGADAVYFGLESGFNARARATNFQLDDLDRIVDFLHRQCVKGYVTLNTLAFSDELSRMEDALRKLATAGIDAVLIQDIGVARLAREVCPDLEIHASTQMTLSSAECIDAVQDLGIRRVVLPRELSLKEIRKIADNTTMPLEVFVHGALCVAYSGQCLTSESLGGRSANRGQCAQACRLPYELICDGEDIDLGRQKYLLSPQDLAAYDLIPELLDAGICSLKIEGRLKTPEYVANTVQHYRSVLDAAIQGRRETFAGKQIDDLEMSFSRGFSPGWLNGCDHKMLVPAVSCAKRGVLLGQVVSVLPEGVSVRLQREIKPGDGIVFEADREHGNEQGGRVYEVWKDDLRCSGAVVDAEVTLVFGNNSIDFKQLTIGQSVWKTDDPALNKRLKASYQSADTKRRVPLRIQVSIAVGSPIKLSAVADNAAVVNLQSEHVVEEARRHPMTLEVLQQQLGRLGATVYQLDEVTADLSGNPMVPLSVLGVLRRQLVEALAPTGVGASRKVSKLPVLATMQAGLKDQQPPVNSRQLELNLLCRTLSQLDTLLDVVQDDGSGLVHERIYVDFADIREYSQAIQQGRERGVLVYPATPRIQKPGELGLFRLMSKQAPEGVLVRNLAGLKYFREQSIPTVVDFSLNVTNELTAEWINAQGALRMTPSYDLNRDQLLDLVRVIPSEWLEVVVHQHMPMFHMEHCVFCSVLSPGTNKTNCGRPCDFHEVKLRDRIGKEHLLTADVGCRNTLYNATAQSAAEVIPVLQQSGVRSFRLEFLSDDQDDLVNTVTLYRQLLAGKIAPSEVWQQLQASNRVGVTRGTLEERRNPLAIL